MIGSIKGNITLKQNPIVMVDCNGVGYEVEISMTSFQNMPSIGSSISFYTHLQVTENSQTLYGFEGLSDRSLFRALLKINGVGAKLALAILSSMTVHEFEMAISSNDSESLVRIPGVGKKTADRLVIEMRDKLMDVEGHASAEKETEFNNARKEAFDALLALGYKLPEVKKIMANIKPGNKKVDEILRIALKQVDN
ncbi:MAG: Holliday junction branch migration protein RuvA [Woeseiaceae bacterium]|nr:Holliday junction branch migration protein RuvA [Woeseiaceae bacterium]